MGSTLARCRLAHSRTRSSSRVSSLSRECLPSIVDVVAIGVGAEVVRVVLVLCQPTSKTVYTSLKFLANIFKNSRKYKKFQKTIRQKTHAVS